VINFIKLNPCIPEIGEKMLPKVLIWPFVVLLWSHLWPVDRKI